MISQSIIFLTSTQDTMVSGWGIRLYRFLTLAVHLLLRYLPHCSWIKKVSLQLGYSLDSKYVPDKLPNISLQCSRMSLNTMRGKPGQQFSIYCTFQDHIQPTVTGHFQFKVQKYGIAYRRILETAHQSIGLNANWSAICSLITKMR